MQQLLFLHLGVVVILCFCTHGRLFKVPSEKLKCSVFFPNGFQLEWWGRPLNCLWLFRVVSQYVVWTSCRKWVLEEIACGNNRCIFLGNLCSFASYCRLTRIDCTWFCRSWWITQFSLWFEQPIYSLFPLSIGITLNGWNLNVWGGFASAKSKVMWRFNTVKIWACWWQKTSPMSLLSPSHSCWSAGNH